MTYDEFIEEWNSPSPTVVVHTSGSTGEPKLMQASKEKMRASARITCDFLQLQPGDHALLCMSLDYIAGKMMVVRALERGLQLFRVEPSGHPLATVDEPIDFAAMVPMQVFNSLQVPAERDKLRNIRHLIIGGGAIDDDLAAALHDFPNAVWSTYGMTETLSHIALRRLSGEMASGWYTPFDGVEVSLNALGCLVINAPAVCDTPLETHDLAELAATEDAIRPLQHRFRIIGRLDNVVNTGGVKVQIEELEGMIKPFVSVPFMVSKCKDAKFGEKIVLLLEQNAVDRLVDGSNCTVNTYLSNLHRQLLKALPQYHSPRLYMLFDELPHTATRKPARAKAMQMIADADLTTGNVLIV